MSAAGTLVVVAGVVLLVDGLEQARALAAGEMSAAAWGTRVLARWPGRAVAVLPVAVVLGVARVAASWERDGHLATLEACGVRPARLAVLAGAAALLVAVGGLLARELVATRTAAVLAGEGSWTAVADGGERLLVRAERVSASGADGVRAARIRDGALVAWMEASSARWDGEWSLVGARGDVIALPDPGSWRLAAVPSGPDAPLSRWWTAPASPARGAWLWDRVATAIGTALLAVAALPAVRSAKGRGVLGAVVGVAAWRLLQGGAVTMEARGLWPPGSAIGVALALAALAALLALIRADRGAG